MRTLTARLLRSMWNKGGVAVALVGLSMGYLAWVFPLDGNPTFDARTVVGIAVPATLLVLALGIPVTAVLLEMQSELDAKSALPRATWGGSGPNDAPLCLLEPSELFAHGLAVSFYLVNAHGFEDFIGVGSVLNVQDDRRIQVTIIGTNGDRTEILNALTNNEKEALDRLRVRPTIPLQDLHLTRIGATDG